MLKLTGPPLAARPVKRFVRLKTSELANKSSRAMGGRVPPDAGTGVYIDIHEDSEHRRNARSRAQQVFSQALTLPQAWVGLSVWEKNDLQIQNAE